MNTTDSPYLLTTIHTSFVEETPLPKSVIASKSHIFSPFCDPDYLSQLVPAKSGLNSKVVAGAEDKVGAAASGTAEARS